MQTNLTKKVIKMAHKKKLYINPTYKYNYKSLHKTNQFQCFMLGMQVWFNITKTINVISTEKEFH